MSGRLKKKYGILGDPREELYESARQWAEAVGAHPFLGGDSPNLADLSTFGAIRSITETDTFMWGPPTCPLYMQFSWAMCHSGYSMYIFSTTRAITRTRTDTCVRESASLLPNCRHVPESTPCAEMVPNAFIFASESSKVIISSGSAITTGRCNQQLNIDDQISKSSSVPTLCCATGEHPAPPVAASLQTHCFADGIAPSILDVCTRSMRRRFSSPSGGRRRKPAHLRLLALMAKLVY